MTDAQAGIRLGRYRLLAELGHGGMGVVWLARDEQLNRTVAVKLLDAQVAASAEFRARFAREMRIAVRLEHPNVVPVYDAGDIDGQMFIVMRFVKGSDLGVVLRDGRLEAERAARIATMLGSALDAAHTIGLVHRDVKPANILIADPGPDEHAYLTDFGISRDRVADSTLTRTGEWMGSADYVSPEQLDGRPATAQSDIYSLTCLLFHAITGAPPYPGPTIAKLKGHALDPFPSIGPIHPCAAQIDRVLERGAQKRPEDRYASAGELAAAFSEAVAGGSVAWSGPGTETRTRAVPTTPMSRAAAPGAHDALTTGLPSSRGRRSPTRAVVAAAAVAAIVVVGVLVALLPSSTGSPGHRSAQAGFALTILGDRTDSVWYVRQGDRYWSSTGAFVATGSPSVATGGGRSVIAARGARDDTIWYSTVGIPGWSSTGGPGLFRGASDPAIGVGTTGQITIADRGTNNTVWYVQPGLRSWTSTGGFTATGNPAIAENDGRTVIAARSLHDGSIWYTTIGAKGWTQTAPASAFTGAGDPAIAIGLTGQVTIADRDTNNTVWYVQPGRRAWTALGGFVATGNPALTTR